MIDKQQVAVGNVVSAMHAQDALNARLDKLWDAKGWPYYRAAWTEMAEAIGHLNWFWWKQGTFGKAPSQEQAEQLHMELVDVLHFGLSMDVALARRRTTTPESYAKFLTERATTLVRAFEATSGFGTITDTMEAYVRYTIGSHEFETLAFVNVCRAAGLSLENLLVMYFAKQTLNKLRWNNGYDLTKSDPDVYVKIWPSTANRKLLQEDNVHLVEILNEALKSKFPKDAIMDAIADGTLVAYLYGRLSERYNARGS